MPIECPIQFPRMEREEFRRLDFQVMKLIFETHGCLGRSCDEVIYTATHHKLSFCEGLLLQMGDARPNCTNRRRRRSGWKGVERESRQRALGRRILGTRTAHPYQPCEARHRRAGKEPLCRVRDFGSVTAQAPKKVRRPCRSRKSGAHHPLLLRGLLLKVGGARQES